MFARCWRQDSGRHSVKAGRQERACEWHRRLQYLCSPGSPSVCVCEMVSHSQLWIQASTLRFPLGFFRFSPVISQLPQDPSGGRGGQTGDCCRLCFCHCSSLWSICLTHHAFAHWSVQCLSTIRAKAMKWRCAMRRSRVFRRSNFEKVLEDSLPSLLARRWWSGQRKPWPLWSRMVLGVPMTAEGRSARSLGIVASVGNRRGRLHATRKVRPIQVKHGMVRIARSRKASKAGGANVCVAQIVTSMLHNVGVAGLSPTRLKQGRSQTATALLVRWAPAVG